MYVLTVNSHARWTALPFRVHPFPPPLSPSLPPSSLSSPPVLTPTELIPGACFARSATLPTHALTLSVPASAGKRFPAFFSSSLLPPTPKGCESLADTLMHQQGSCVLDGEGLTSLFIFFYFFCLGLWSIAHYDEVWLAHRYNTLKHSLCNCARWL